MFGYRFHNPDSFQLLWLIPLIVIAAVIVLMKHRARLKMAIGIRLTPYLTASVSPVRRTLKLTLEMLTIFAMVLALARPQQGEGRQEIKSKGVELIFALDVSNSMLAEDHKPNRLEHAKRELNHLMDQLAGDRVGLIAFAGNAILISPLTNDYSSIRMFLDSLSPESVSDQGTSFKRVIEEAQGAFKRGGLSDEENTRVARVLLIATDGEDQEADALKAAQSATDKGLRIFTIGFGTRKGAPIPLRDDHGNLIGYKKDRSGQTILSMANDAVLESLARAGRGSYHHATFVGDEVKTIKMELDRLEKAEFESQTMSTYNERYQPVLLLALLLGLFELFLGERKRAGRIWRGRFEVAEP